MISLEKIKILVPLQKLLKNLGDLAILIVAPCFEIVAQSPINRPIWPHCLWRTNDIELIEPAFDRMNAMIPVA